MKEEPIHNIGTEKWLSMSEAAPFTPYSAEYLSLLARKGKLPSKKIKNTWYTTKNALDAYMQRQMFKAQIELEPIRSYYGDINKYFPQDDTPLPTEKTEHIEKALEKVLEKKITEQEAKNRLEAERVKIRESKFIEPENKSHFKTVLSSKMLVGSTVALFILLSVMPIPIVFSFFDKSLNYVKEVLNDANTVMGFRPGTHANELLLLDKEGNISIMGHIETKGQFKSFVAQGMAPIVVDSKTLVKNLNAEFLGGASSTDFTLAFVTANGNITAENVELQGKVEIGQTLLIRGATKLLSNLDVGGKLKVFGNAEFRQALDVLGPAYFESLVTLANDAKISGNLSVSKNISVRGGLESLSSVIGKSGSFGSLGTGNFSASGKIALNGGSNAVTIDATNITLDKNGNAVFDGNVSALSFNGSSLTIVDATSTNATSTNLFATNATLGNLVLSASTSLQNFTFVNATGTSATTTNFYADKIRSLLATITSIVADDITTGALTATNSTTTSATSTDFFAGTLFARTLNIGGSATSTINSSGDLLVVGSTTLQNFTFVNATGTSATTTNFFTTNASTTDFRTNTATIGTLTSGQTTISNLTSGRIPYISTAGLLADTSALLWDNTLSRLTATNAIFTTSTSTSATSTSFFSTTASSTNLFFTTGNGGNITSTGLGTFANILANASSTFQNFTFTTATGTSATTTNFFSTTASSTNLFSTSLTTGNSTLGAITSGLINSQTISSAADFTGTLNVATGFKIGNAAAAGKILRGNGTNYIASTATLADTYGASELLYSNGANTVQGLTTTASSILVTNGSSVPAWTTTLPAFTLGGAVTGNSQNITGLNQITVTGITATSTFSTGGLTVGTSQFVVQQSSGNVGIGTIGPGAALDVAGKLQFSNPSGNTGLISNGGATGDVRLFGGSSGTNGAGIVLYGGSHGATPDQMSFYQGSSEVARLNASDQFLFSNGAIGTPAMAFINDPDSGFYTVGTGQMRLAVDGVISNYWDASQVTQYISGVQVSNTTVNGLDLTRTSGDLTLDLTTTTSGQGYLRVNGIGTGTTLPTATTNAGASNLILRTTSTTNGHYSSILARDGTGSNQNIAGIVFVTDAFSAGASSGSMQFYTRPASGALTSAMTISNTQNVGIGTTTPQTTFHVKGAGCISSTGSCSSTADGALTVSGNLWLAAGALSAPSLRFSDSGDTGLAELSNGSVSLVAGGVEGLRVIGGGNVGIGTTSPYARFSVEHLSSTGTVIGADSLTGFTGNLLDLKVASTTKFSINQAGDVYSSGSSTLQNFTFVNATGTSATTTNFFSTTASSTNLFSTSLTTGNSTLGAITSGLINSQTISSAADFTGTLNVATGFKIGNAAAAGKILRGNGTNYIASTATLADTYGASELLYSNGANTVQGLTTTASSILVTNGSSVPAWTTTLPAFTLGGTVSGGGNNINNVIIGAVTPLAGTFTAVTGTSVTDSGLTSGRVTFAGTGGLLSDDADLTFSTDTLSATKLLSATSVSTPSFISTAAITATPTAGNNFNIALSTTGDFTVNTDDLYVDTSSGFIGVGTTSPYARFSVEHLSSTGTVIGADSLTGFTGNLLDLKVASTTKFSINQAGDVYSSGSSTLQNFTFVNATGTSATTTNFFSTTASSTNLFSTSLTTGNSTLGAITSGLINSQTISSVADFTGTLNVATGFKIGNAAAAGKILRGNGTNYIASTATLADTYGASELLYSNGANTVQGLTTTASSILVTNGSSVPAWTTTLPAFTLGGAVTGNSQNITGLNQITVTGITATSTFSTGGLTVGTSQFVVQQNSGNVGIGTTGPQGRLVVKDTGQAVNTWTSLADAATDASFRFFGSSHANEYGIFMGYANTANDAQGIQATQTGGAFAYPLLLNPFGGNVGIGTTTPQYLLDVAGAAIINGVGVATFANEPTLNEIVLRLGAGAGGQGVDRGSALVFGGPLNNNDATQATYGIVAGFKDADASGTGTGGLRFYTANNTTAAEAMRITGSGNVGIGTTSPVSKLSVLGESAFAGGASVGIGYAGTAAPTGGLIIQGNVGIGTTGPAGKLDIRSSATYLDTRWQVGGDNDFFFRIISNGSEKAGISYDATDNLLELCHSEFGVSPTSCSHLVIANGKVGIGTTTPVSTLSIQGSLCVRDTGSCGTTAGTIYATTAAITDIDLAENYSTRDTTLSAGEVVAFDTTGAVMVKRAIAGDRLAGVISTAPGVLLGKELTNSKPVALAGRVPVKVSLEGGPILIGDYLSLSSIPGVAKKAGDGEQSIGYALEDYTETSSASTIQLFVTHSNLSGLSLTDLTEKLSQEPAPDSLASKFLSNLFARITTWLADVSNGIERIFVKTISSEIVYTKELCIDDICINKEQFKTLLEKNGIGVTVSAMTSEPSINSESTPVVEATPEASPEVIPESISTSEPAPTVEPVSEPTSEVTSTPEPTPESEPEPEPTPTPEVTPQSSDEPTADEAEPAPEPPAE